ncbi:MAG TPA: cbb3-type cytochrome oxidase assembly protein CcoS [Phycisphaerales bacterium]|nr:cbb3-type cytochrome oxidase assembly protein CcoS [Phycisphaerales bacterium]
MSVLFVMLPLALLTAGFFVWMFIRAVRGGQFDDLDSPPIRAIFDDDEFNPDKRPERRADAGRDAGPDTGPDAGAGVDEQNRAQ